MAWLRSTPLLLVLAAGCSGQDVGGRWIGPFPLEGAHECDLRLRGDRTATVACDGAAIVGAGRYRWNGARLTLDLSVLTYDAHKVQAPAPFEFEVRGEGNTLRAEREGRVYDWRRTLR